MKQRYCIYCKSNQTYIDPKGYVIWFNIDNKSCCNKCYYKYISNPKTCAKWNKKVLSYKGKRIYIKEKNLTGTCSNCKKSIGDTYINSRGKLAVIKRTNTHHIKYHDHNILKDTIELCVSCHDKLTHKKRKKESYLIIKIPMNKRICDFCNSKKTYIYKNTPHWYNIDNKLSCSKCHNKYYNLKRKNKEKKLLSS